jgi:hypothetical protein
VVLTISTACVHSAHPGCLCLAQFGLVLVFVLETQQLTKAPVGQAAARRKPILPALAALTFVSKDDTKIGTLDSKAGCQAIRIRAPDRMI